MKEILGLLFVLLMWLLPSLLQKKKKADAANKQVKQSHIADSEAQVESKNTNAQLNADVDKMLEKLFGIKVNIPEHEAAMVGNEIVESNAEIKNISNNKNFASEYETMNIFNEGESDFFKKNINEKVGDKSFVEDSLKSEKNIHPLLSDFDVKKAFIYSEIMQTKYF